jgi:hypothetical protein
MAVKWLAVKPLTKLSISALGMRSLPAADIVLACPRASPMVKPKSKPKKKPPTDGDAEPTPSVVPTSAFSIGDAVHHPMFGDGKVEGIEDNKLTIAFEGQVTKVIREDFVTRKR